MSLSDSCDSLPSLSHSITSTASYASVPIDPIRIVYPSTQLRENEHLAVSLPSQLWKPDDAATTCDNLYCGARFTLLNRRHHCRKCGGIFCDACTSRTTTLLDTANMNFIQPPRHVPIKTFESPRSPVLTSRVCNDCWDQIHGYPTTPFTPAALQPSLQQAFSVPISKLSQPLANFFVSPKHIPFSLPSITFSTWPKIGAPSDSPSSSSNNGSQSTRDGASKRARNVTFELPAAGGASHGVQTLPNTAGASGVNHSTGSRHYAPNVQSRLQSHTSEHLAFHNYYLSLRDTPPTRSTFDAYPLRLPSILCKANGGGRWVPKPLPLRESYSPPLPGYKAQWELDEEEENRREFERRYRPNPLTCDGPIKYRVPKEREDEPRFICRSPCREEATY